MLAESSLYNICIIVITLIVITIAYFQWTYQYFQRKKVPHLTPKFPFGNFSRNQPIFVQTTNIYNIMKKKKWKIGGLYGLLSKFYLITDLKILRNIMSKDFEYFPDRGIYHNEKADPLSGHLFNLEGSEWKNLRVQLTPTFTSGKIKSMFQSILECEQNLVQKLISLSKEPVDIKDVLGCFTTDVIGSCAFGLEFKTFEDENSLFRIYGKRVFERDFTGRVKRRFANAFPTLSKLLNFPILPRNITEFFMKMVQDTVDFREKQGLIRNDFLQLLIDIRNKPNGLSIERMCAQSFVFFLAGFETSSTAMTFALYELAKNEEIQNKARSEIQRVLSKFDNKITYDGLQEMKYLNQIVDEALRKYPPAPLMVRRCVKDYQVDGITIEKGQMVLIPIHAIHNDPDYYPDPNTFDPERFSDQNKKLRDSYAHIPFGEGPRICIGMRFGLIQTKVGICSLLNNFRFSVNGRMKEPLAFKTNSPVMAVRDEVWLDVHKI